MGANITVSPRGNLTAPSKEPSALLTAEEVKQCLLISEPLLVEETFVRSQAMVADEAARTVRLDQKANALLAGVGIALGLAISKGASDYTSRWLLVGAVFAGVSVTLALIALSVRKHLRTDERNVFGARAIYKSESVPDAEAALVIYRRTMMVANWEALRVTLKWNDFRAVLIAWGQLCFGGAILCVILAVFAKVFQIAAPF